jgi:hypothetical protein
MPNPENIIPPKKGEIRNPKGKPKGKRNRSTIIKKWLRATEKSTNPITELPEVLSQEDLIVLAAIKEAREGNISAFKELMDSLYGKVSDKIDHSNKDGSLSRKTVNELFPQDDEFDRCAK